jgi:sulfate transport system ATP-binding protein
MSIEVRHVKKTYGSFRALNDVSLVVPAGKLVALLGPSGSGKTTLLRVIAGLEVPDSGQILFDGEDATKRSAGDRHVGFVFQHYTLFRHMSVFENIAFGLKVRPRKQRPSDEQIRAKVHQLLQLIQLDWLADRLPSQLSGGQRQRVALARALAVEPQVLLLDEPFGALDAKVRQELRRWLRRLHSELSITSVFVTHDQEEALEVADLVVVTNEGTIQQVGTPDEVYDHPANPFVFKFLGNVNLFHGRVEGGKAYINDTVMHLPKGQQLPSGEAEVYVRPHHLQITHQPRNGGYFPAQVKDFTRAGPLVKVELMTKLGETVQVDLTQDRFRALRLKRNAEVYVSPREVKIFDVGAK